ncbi:MAG: transposase [Aphanocapsa sp. GSE-SYN-MK-11-07L]|jgi:transposase|nr:transposase [Aphanocapsa sp. GSE-SYN-MK-11-07L]
MTPKPRRLFTDEQKAEAVRIVNQSGKPVSQIAKEMGLSESALRRWVNQARIDRQPNPQGQLTSAERKELIALRRDLKRVQRSRDFLTAVALSGGTPPTPCLKKAATFLRQSVGRLCRLEATAVAQESSDPLS